VAIPNLRVHPKGVPNAPCGVERKYSEPIGHISSIVPNAPCGVESDEQAKYLGFESWVPNAPCGVESYLLSVSHVLSYGCS